ncbi:amidase [Pseudonocardia sp. GCM10023141]|uniref:amidase n=1 Tax=Pseudonocardia sp. GCM10023141 TaxID=3252653 RepID=UPI00360AC7ED
MQVPDLGSATIPHLQELRDGGELTAVALTLAYLQRIEELDDRIRAVIALDPTASGQAAASDARHRAGTLRGPLDGIPVLLKDNIDTADLPTTAGSRALTGAPPARDAALVTVLHAAGAVVLGKTNLSEWANFRSTHSTSGWSSVGGQTVNPHVLDRSPCGSSSGSGAAVAAALCQVAIGTETDGSIVCPAGINGIVGLKPTLGLVDGTGIVPLSAEQDTAGPMARHVIDAALTLGVLAGRAYPIGPDALRGTRIGVWRKAGADADADRVFAAAVDTVVAQGATVIDVVLPFAREIDEAEYPAMLTEFRRDLEPYLRTRPDAPQTLPALMAFNEQDPVALARFGQELFEHSAAAPDGDDPDYRRQRATVTELARRCIDETLARHDLIAIMAPTNGPAWAIDYEAGDAGSVGSSRPAAVAGYPNIAVPAGAAGPLPIGVSFFAGRGTEATLIDLAAAFEAATRARREPRLLPTLP